MEKKVIAGSVVGLLAPLLISPAVSLADQISTAQSNSVVAQQSSSTAKQSSSALSSLQQQQATYVGEGGMEPGNVKLVNAQTESSQVAWGFDQDVTNEVDPVYVNNNGAGTNAVGKVPFPVYQDQGDLVSALSAKGLSQEQISSVVAAMILAEQGTYKSAFTASPHDSAEMQNAIYNYQAQVVIDVLVGQVDQHQVDFIKQHFTPFQQKLYNAAMGDANLSVDEMTTAYLVAPGSTQQLSKLQLNMQTKTTSQFELNPNYLGAPVKVSQILPANYQVIDVATNQPVSELTTGHTYYVKTTAAVAQATVAMQYAKEVFSYFSTNSKPVALEEEGIRGQGAGYAITPREATQIPIYYNANGDYIGPLQTFDGDPIVKVTGLDGDRNVRVMRHLYDHNQSHMTRGISYVGLMTNTTMMQNLTLQIFADVPAQSSSSSKPTDQSSISATNTVSTDKSGSTTSTISSSKANSTVAPAQNNVVKSMPAQTTRYATVNAQEQAQHSTVLTRSHKRQQLPATGDQQAKGLALLGMALVGLGLGYAELKRVKKTH